MYKTNDVGCHQELKMYCLRNCSCNKCNVAQRKKGEKDAKVSCIHSKRAQKKIIRSNMNGPLLRRRKVLRV